MRTKDHIGLEKVYSLIMESRAAGAESQVAGESAKALAIEKTLIKSITEDLNTTAAHLQNIQPLIGTFEEGALGEDFQTLMTAIQSVQAAAESLQGRMPEEEESVEGEGEGGEAPSDFPENGGEGEMPPV